MQVGRGKICILIILHNVSIAREDSGQRKTINGCNDSLGALLFFLAAPLQQRHGVVLTLVNAGFFVDQHSADVAKIGIGHGQISLGCELDSCSLCPGADEPVAQSCALFGGYCND